VVRLEPDGRGSLHGTSSTAILTGMASAIFDTHSFVKRLTAVRMPEQQAEIWPRSRRG
jgi:hypothetical protein